MVKLFLFDATPIIKIALVQVLSQDANLRQAFDEILCQFANRIVVYGGDGDGAAHVASDKHFGLKLGDVQCPPSKKKGKRSLGHEYKALWAIDKIATVLIMLLLSDCLPPSYFFQTFVTGAVAARVRSKPYCSFGCIYTYLL
jgi:hypothetical protein